MVSEQWCGGGGGDSNDSSGSGVRASTDGGDDGGDGVMVMVVLMVVMVEMGVVGLGLGSNWWEHIVLQSGSSGNNGEVSKSHVGKACDYHCIFITHLYVL